MYLCVYSTVYACSLQLRVHVNILAHEGARAIRLVARDGPTTTTSNEVRTVGKHPMIEVFYLYGRADF